jgi:hypothetical protein
LPQAPQLLSVVVSVQVPLQQAPRWGWGVVKKQAVSLLQGPPLNCWHTPAAQVEPVGHTLPQFPQLLLSVAKSFPFRQVPLQQMSPAQQGVFAQLPPSDPHGVMHVPFWQVWPEGQQAALA